MRDFCAEERMEVDGRGGRPDGGLQPRTRRPGLVDLWLGFDVAACQALFFQILLVVILGLVESHCGNDLGDDGLAEAVGFFQLLF